MHTKGITFGNYHSYRDFGLILSSKVIGAPSPKTEQIDIPGGDGVLDLTEFFGEVKYNNRTLTFEFSTIVPQSEFMPLFSRVQNALHGQKMKITLDDEPEWFYIGRLSVSEWKAEKRIGKLTVECDCEPFKYRISSFTVNLTGKNRINLAAAFTHGEGTWMQDGQSLSYTRGTGTGGSFVYWTVPVEKGKSYVFSADYTLTTRLLYVYKDKLYGELVAKVQNGSPCIFTAEKTGMYVFGAYVTSSAVDGTFSNIMLEEGTARTAFVPYDTTERNEFITFQNERKPAIPTMYAHGHITVESPSTFITLNEGAQIVTNFTFRDGATPLTFKGNGVVVVEWKDGGL